MRQATLPVCKRPAEQSDHLNKLISHLIYGLNLPFSTVESVPFRRFLDSLLPGAKVPCKQLVSGPLLDAAYERQIVWLRKKVFHF